MEEEFKFYPPKNNPINYLKHLFETAYLSDLELILKDDNHCYYMRAHKIFISSIPYFKMLINNTRSNILEVILPDANITRKIIASIYGIELVLDDDEKIGYLRCCNFLNIETDYQILEKIKPEQFDSLIILASEYNYHNFFLELIVKNIPDDYDLRKFSDEFLALLRDETTIHPFDYFARINNRYINEHYDIILKSKIEKGVYITKQNFNGIIPQSQFEIVYPHNIESIKYYDRIVFSDDCAVAAIMTDYFDRAAFTRDHKFLVIACGHRISVIDIANSITTDFKLNKSGGTIVGLSIFNNMIFCPRLGGSHINGYPHHDIININFKTGSMITLKEKDDNYSDIFDIFALSENKIIVLHIRCFRIFRIDENDMLHNIFSYFYSYQIGIHPRCISIDSDCYNISPNYKYFALYRQRDETLLIHCNETQQILIKSIFVKCPVLIYFSSDNKHIIFRNDTYSYVLISDDKISDLMTEDVPEKKYPNISTVLTRQIDSILDTA